MKTPVLTPHTALCLEKNIILLWIISGATAIFFFYNEYPSIFLYISLTGGYGTICTRTQPLSGSVGNDSQTHKTVCHLRGFCLLPNFVFG